MSNQNSNYNSALIRRRRPAGLVAIVLTMLLGLSACERINDAVRNWGERSRRNTAEDLREEELKKWERDLNLSRARVRELHKTVFEIVQESNRQGLLSWKIARAYMSDQRFEMAATYYKGALENRIPDPAEESALFEAALPFFREALQRRKINEDLLFETALCYANASRSMGWEKQRWRTAVYLFDQMRALKPDDSRATYQLALLHGKVNREELRDRDRAIRLLTELIKREEHNLPAHFARAHIMTEKGDLGKALQAYSQLREQMEVLNDDGVIGGDLKKNPQYQRLMVNIEKLEVCVNNLPGAKFRDDEERSDGMDAEERRRLFRAGLLLAHLSVNPALYRSGGWLQTAGPGADDWKAFLGEYFPRSVLRTAFKRAREQLAGLSRTEIDFRILTIWEAEYPAALRAIFDPPPALLSAALCRPRRYR